jgi:DNA replication protein DnaC
LTDGLCKECDGTGWIIKKRDNREIAVKCDCQKADIFFSKGKRANIPPRFLGAELSSFFPDEKRPSLLKAKRAAETFIEDYPAVTDGLMFQGPTGVGKTRLLCSIATGIMRRLDNIEVYYIDWNDLVRLMRSGEDASSRDYYAINELVRKLTSVDLLLFDEFGASKVSPWVYDNIYFVINRRYNTQKITCFASNFMDGADNDGRESLKIRVGERIRSRLFEMATAIEMKGSDYRKLNG